MSSPTARRRQRSTRLTVAVLLLTIAGVLVTSAFLGDAAWFQAAAAFSAVALGAAATRITHTELLESRRDAARDRAEQAQDYRELTERRTAEHEAFVASMRARAERQDHALAELETALTSAQRRAAEATLKRSAEARRADLAEERAGAADLRVAELEQERDVLRAELDLVRAELAHWEAAPQRMRA